MLVHLAHGAARLVLGLGELFLELGDACLVLGDLLLEGIEVLGRLIEGGGGVLDFFWVSVSVAAVSVVIALAGTGNSTLANSAAVTPAPVIRRRVRPLRHVACRLGVASMCILVCLLTI